MKNRINKTKKYSLFQEKPKKFLKRHPYLIPTTGFVVGFVLILGIFVSMGSQTVGPSDSRLISLFVDGQEQTVATRAQTVGELTKKLNLDLIEEDIIEPSAETPINEDNLQINIYRAKAMTVIDGATKIATLSAHKSPRLVATKAGVQLNTEDNINFQQGDISEGIVGQKVVVDRAVPINLVVYGAVLPARTQAGTVGELLSEKNIKINEGDTLVPSAETPISENMQVVISRFGQQIVVQEEVINPPVEYVRDPNLPAGVTSLREPGVPGKKVVTYQLQLENGVEIGRTVIQEIVLTQPIKEVRVRGVKVAFSDVSGQKAQIMAAAGISPADYGYVDYIISRESRWNAAASNSRGCWGLGQACPGSKLAIACPNWQNDPVCQLGWFSGYAKGRYGTWASAYNFWLAKHWW